MGFGVAITRYGSLGVSPISSIPNVISIRFDFLTFGTWLAIWNMILLVGQIIVLRKQFKIVNLLQVPLTVVFGWFTDFGGFVISFFPNDIYVLKVLYVLLGTLILAFGISVTIAANVILCSGEAFVQAVSIVTGKQFGNIKVILDVSYVIVSVILSFLFFGSIVGAREGTFFAAVFTGILVKIISPVVNKPLNNLISR